jgi:hypothetical protein
VIPETEWNYYVDQQLNRKLFISNSVDKAASELLQKRKLKIERQNEREKRKRESSLDVVPLINSSQSIVRPIEQSKVSHCEFP